MATATATERHETGVTAYERDGDPTQYKATCVCGWSCSWWRGDRDEAELDASDHVVARARVGG